MSIEHLFEVMYLEELLVFVDAFEIAVLKREDKNIVVDALLKVPSDDIEFALSQLPRNDLYDFCRRLHIVKPGRTKASILKTIFAYNKESAAEVMQAPLLNTSLPEVIPVPAVSVPVDTEESAQSKMIAAVSTPMVLPASVPAAVHMDTDSGPSTVSNESISSEVLSLVSNTNTQASGPESIITNALSSLSQEIAPEPQAEKKIRTILRSRKDKTQNRSARASVASSEADLVAKAWDPAAFASSHKELDVFSAKKALELLFRPRETNS